MATAAVVHCGPTGLAFSYLAGSATAQRRQMCNGVLHYFLESGYRGAWRWPIASYRPRAAVHAHHRLAIDDVEVVLHQPANPSSLWTGRSPSPQTRVGLPQMEAAGLMPIARGPAVTQFVVRPVRGNDSFRLARSRPRIVGFPQWRSAYCNELRGRRGAEVLVASRSSACRTSEPGREDRYLGDSQTRLIRSTCVLEPSRQGQVPACDAVE